MSVSESMQPYWQQLACRFPQIEAVFDDCMQAALRNLSPDGVNAYLNNASVLGKMGYGHEPVLIYLEEMPEVAARLGEEALPEVKTFVWWLARHTNAPAIVPFLQSLNGVSQCLKSLELLYDYIDLLREMAERTTGSVHGHHTTFPSPGLPNMLEKATQILGMVSLQGMRNWVNYGIQYYSTHPEQQKAFFSLQSADARAVLQGERHGTLFMNHERKLDLYLRALWHDHDHLVPYSQAFDDLRKPIPHLDAQGIHLPDVLENKNGISGMDRYRAILSHIAAHRCWSEKMVVDNWSPYQRLAVETFEDCRVDWLAIRRYPGLKSLFLSLHPIPDESGLELEGCSTIRLRLALFSRAVLDAGFTVKHPVIRDFVGRFHALMADKKTRSSDVASLALLFMAHTRTQHDDALHTYTENTEVDYRDDNRHLWICMAAEEEEELFEQQQVDRQDELDSLPPRHYHEWDYTAQYYRPDWVSVYECLHPAGDAGFTHALLEKHSALAKRLKRILDLLKPQDKVRIRFQEEGSELDLDVALRSLIDYKSGSTPDPRINMSHRTDGRNIAVSLLLDLSESLNEKVAGGEQTILELSQEAVSLLAWTVDRLGDPLAIGGFHSNTRHEVRYYHLKGFSEGWNDDVKGRLAAMKAGYSTRMGAAMRHAAHYLKAQQADKKVMLILTDGMPSDIDVDDERLLIEDARQAVKELDQDGIFTWCVSLDAKADEYVADIFANRYAVIDNIERLPEKLPELFISLTH